MAKIKLNNNEYLISDSTLATPTADFITHLGTVAGNGIKVVVNGVEYNVDINKLNTTISDLERVFADISKPSSDGSTQKGTPVIAPADGSQVEAIYINTALSTEEVVAILSQLENLSEVAWQCFDSGNMMNVFYDDYDGFCSISLNHEEIFNSDFGWAIDAPSVLEGPFALRAQGSYAGNGEYIGTNQEAYASLISLTPFEMMLW